MFAFAICLSVLFALDFIGSFIVFMEVAAKISNPIKLASYAVSQLVVIGSKIALLIWLWVMAL